MISTGPGADDRWSLVTFVPTPSGGGLVVPRRPGPAPLRHGLTLALTELSASARATARPTARATSDCLAQFGCQL